MTDKKKQVGLPIRNFTQDVCGDEFKQKCEEYIRSIGKDCRFFGDDAVLRTFGHPDWPRGTEVVVYARKEDREKALVKVSQMGYAVTKFVEVDGLQAEIMGEGRFLAAKADALRQPVHWEVPLSTAGRAQEDSMRNSVIYPSRELIEQMKRDYPKWRSQMLGVPDMSDDKTKE